MNIRRHVKTKGQKYYSTFLFSIYTHTERGSSAAIADIIFSLLLSSLAFFFVSMKDSHSHLTKLWAWLKAVRTTEFSKKLIVCKTQKLPNAPDITSLEDGKIRFQSEEKEFYCLECFLKLWHIFLSGKTEYFKCTEFFQI